MCLGDSLKHGLSKILKSKEEGNRRAGLASRFVNSIRYCYDIK